MIILSYLSFILYPDLFISLSNPPVLLLYIFIKLINSSVNLLYLIVTHLSQYYILEHTSLLLIFMQNLVLIIFLTFQVYFLDNLHKEILVEIFDVEILNASNFRY